VGTALAQGDKTDLRERTGSLFVAWSENQAGDGRAVPPAWPWGVAEPGRGKPWSGGGFEGDLVAQCFELADVVAFLAVRADAVVIEVGA
jgi:hypothetical protein